MACAGCCFVSATGRYLVAGLEHRRTALSLGSDAFLYKPPRAGGRRQARRNRLPSPRLAPSRLQPGQARPGSAGPLGPGQGPGKGSRKGPGPGLGALGPGPASAAFHPRAGGCALRGHRWKLPDFGSFPMLPQNPCSAGKQADCCYC